MHPGVIEKRMEEAGELSRQERHSDSLAIIEGIKHFLPNSPVLLQMRVRNLAALGRTDEAVQDCERLLNRLNQIRTAGNVLDDMLDIEQAVQLAELVTEQTDNASTLKSMLDRRQAEALDKESLQSTVSMLQARLESFLTQRDQTMREQAELIDELKGLRERERSTTEALEQAHSELDALKHQLVKQEAAVADAEQELADRERLVARLENEVQTLQRRSQSAAQSEELLNQELDRLRQQGDAKSEELEKARQELEHLQASLREREQAIETAQASNREHERVLSEMRAEMQRISDEAGKATVAQQTLEEELEQLRRNERSKSDALDAARAQLSALQQDLLQREEAVAAAEARARESEQESASMRRQLETLQSRTETVAASERALAEEIAQLRARETSKTADLQSTRNEMERLQLDLETREALLAEQKARNTLTAEAAKAVQEELEAIKRAAGRYASSEKKLVGELEQLRSSESQKSKVLDTARQEMDRLRSQLERQEKAVAAAEAASSRYDKAVATLQRELQALQEQARHASSSEEELARELIHLRENEAAKSRALEEAQREMAALRASLLQHEQDARAAEAVNRQRLQELRQLHEEMSLLRIRAAETQGAESVLVEEMEKLRRNEAEKNRALEQARHELDALKRVLNEREEAAGRAAREQEHSRGIIAQLEDELAALRHRDLERKSAQTVLQADVSHVRDTISGEAELEDTPQAKQLRRIQEQLAALEAAQQERQREAQRMAAELAAQQSSKRQSQADAARLAEGRSSQFESQLFQLNQALVRPSERRTQQEALRLAQQQSRRQTAQQAAAAVAAPAPLPAAAPPRAEAVRPAAPRLPEMPPQTRPAPPPTESEDDFDDEIVESYPKPRDTTFVFPDQSISMSIARRRSPLRMALAVAVLLLVAGAGIAAFLYRGLQPSDAVEAQPQPVAASPEEKMLRISFPDDRSFGTLYDHNRQPVADAEWRPFSEAQGIVEYPESVRFHLVVRPDQTYDLSPLGNLPPRSLESLWLPSLDINEENLNYLRNLERLDFLYVDQELTERERERIAAVFQGTVSVTSKQPGHALRELTPPDERALAFPEGQSVGRVSLRRWNSGNDPWQPFDAAQGNLTIPARMEVQLEIAPGVSDLTFLEGFAPTALHSIVLSGPAIGDQSLAPLRALRGLQALEMYGTAVTNAGMEHLSAVRSLQFLRIEDTQVSDVGLDVLRDLVLLARIEIVRAPNITARSFPLFRSMLHLHRLHLSDSGVSREQLRQLDRDMPACAVSPID